MDAVHERRESIVRGTAGLAACCLMVATVGCASGSWMSKPSWMTFGQKPPEAAGLASQTAGGDVQKPSATAKPYPTTSTPEGYSLSNPATQASTAPGAAPAAVTYGSTPPPATASVAPPSSTPPAAVAPQVGPYTPSVAAVPPETPTSTPTSPPASAWSASPPLAAVPPASPSAPPAAAGGPPPVSNAPPPWAAPAAASTAPVAAPAQRYADARAASPTWTPELVETPPADGRYGGSGTSRFGGTALPAAAASVMPAAPVSPPAPPAELQPPATTPALQPPAAPLRRPDPGYRPGGTSRYAPARSSLAAESPGVQPASFEIAAPGAR